MTLRILLHRLAARGGYCGECVIGRGGYVEELGERAGRDESTRKEEVVAFFKAWEDSA